jgi:Flp pilus assembly protein TadD
MFKIKRKPSKGSDLIQHARKLEEAGSLRAAEGLYRRILREHPRNADALLALGRIYGRFGQIDGAASYYRQALLVDPGLAEGHYNLGSVLQQKGLYDEAVVHYQEALRLDPSHAMASVNLGSIFQQKGNFDDAILFYRKAVESSPELVSAHNNLGLALQEKGRFEEAMTCHRRALQIDPDHATVHFNLGVLLLMHGELRQGWAEYEWRKKFSNYQARNFARPSWDGGDISGKTIFIHSEKGFEGFGDTLQFVRYVPLIAERGAKVIVECQKELKSLIVNVEGADRVISCGETIPAFDVHSPFLSLPYVFDTTLEDIPSKTPYLAADRRLVLKWKDKVRNNRSGLNVGLVWSGDLKHPRSQYRSCSLDIFAPLARLDKITIYSLQKGEASRQAKNPPAGMNIIDHTDDFSDFSDTAALMENLDLIISVDTGAAHLAGGLGIPVWTLLPFIPEWRWLLNREDSPWYPTMRLFRQPSPGDWNSVIARIADEIDKTQVMRKPIMTRSGNEKQ